MDEKLPRPSAATGDDARGSTIGLDGRVAPGHAFADPRRRDGEADAPWLVSRVGW